MNVAVIGTGYVGLVVGTCLAETGNTVVCVDKDATKVANLRAGVIPIHEPGLEELLARNVESGRLTFTTDTAAAAKNAEVVFIAVGTPPGEDGSADLTHVLSVAREIAPHLRVDAVVATKSTVPVGTAHAVRETLLAQGAAEPVHVCSNPEFLKEGAAVEDFMRPDRVIIGADHDHARSLLAELYAPFMRTGNRLLFMDVASAELTKYAANAMLATRIAFMNELAALCDATGADIDLVRRGIGSDDRIGPAFLFAGPGFGGSCFPKDVRALAATASKLKVPLDIVNAVQHANARQQGVAFQKVQALLGGKVQGKRVAVWGLAFKAETDDIRESSAMKLVHDLLDHGAQVQVHDPVAIANARALLGTRVHYAASSYEACEGAELLAVMTEWREYRSPDFARIAQALTAPRLLDARNLYNPARLQSKGFAYASIGREAVGAPAVVHFVAN